MAEEEDAQMAAKAKKTPSKSPSTPKVVLHMVHMHHKCVFKITMMACQDLTNAVALGRSPCHSCGSRRRQKRLWQRSLPRRGSLKPNAWCGCWMQCESLPVNFASQMQAL